MFGLGIQEIIIVCVLGFPLMLGFVLFVLMALKYLKSGKS